MLGPSVALYREYGREFPRDGGLTLVPRQCSYENARLGMDAGKPRSLRSRVTVSGDNRIVGSGATT